MEKFKKRRIIFIPIISVVLILMGVLLQETELKFVSYLIFYAAITSFLVLFFDIKWLRIPILIVTAPFLLIIFFFRVLTPFFTWIVSQFFAISIILFLTIKIPEFFDYNLAVATKSYLALTLIAIVLTQFGNRIFVFWNSFYESNKIYQSIGIQIYNQKRTRFIIFVCYFLLLILTTFYNLSESQFFEIARIDYAVLQSFATYIAFDRILSIYDASKIKYEFKSICKEYMKVIKIELGIKETVDKKEVA